MRQRLSIPLVLGLLFALCLVPCAAFALVLVGWRTREALIALGGVLVLVTFGHLLLEPLYEFHTHVIPRTGLLLFVLMMPEGADRWSVDGWRRRAIGPHLT